MKNKIKKIIKNTPVINTIAKAILSFRNRTLQTKESLCPPFYLSAGSEVKIPITTHTKEIMTQHVHPSILKFETKINRYTYIIAITPYPFGNDQYENPSIVFSNDLISYSEDKVSNPLVLPPINGHHADTDLVYDPLNNRLLLYYMSRTHMHIMSSIDGVSWRQCADIDVTTCILSPTVIYDPLQSKFKMWFIVYDVNTHEKMLCYLKSDDGVNWNFSNKVLVNYNRPYFNWAYYVVWHLSVQKVGDEYWMISACTPNGVVNGGPPIHLFFANSIDGISWTFFDEPILTTADSLATDRLYQTGFFVDNGMLCALYSYLNKDSTWHVALTSVDVSSLTGNNSSGNVIGAS